ncbi:MAG: twin-arginine translocation signal domain-containing protein [Longimicrobiales bacterium]
MSAQTTRREFLQRLSALGVLLPHGTGLLTQDTLPTRAIPVSGENCPS